MRISEATSRSTTWTERSGSGGRWHTGLWGGDTDEQAQMHHDHNLTEFGHRTRGINLKLNKVKM